MGLDITVYTGTRKVVGERARGILEAECPDDAAYAQGLTIPYINPDFPGREEGVESGAVYEYEGSWSFRAGSYSGHGQFRMSLCRMMGYGKFLRFVRSPEREVEGPKRPFEELINFSDCEGTLGPVVAARLAKDFADHEERAKEFAGGLHHDAYFLERYADWKKAFEDVVEHGGYVEFH
jgi:hypothetical protein